jgi:hypothetical protein
MNMMTAPACSTFAAGRVMVGEYAIAGLDSIDALS